MFERQAVRFIHVQTGFMNRLNQFIEDTCSSKEPFVQDSLVQNINNSVWVARLLPTWHMLAEATRLERTADYPSNIHSKRCLCKTDQHLAAGQLISLNAKKFVFADFKAELMNQLTPPPKFFSGTAFHNKCKSLQLCWHWIRTEQLTQSFS